MILATMCMGLALHKRMRNITTGNVANHIIQCVLKLFLWALWRREHVNPEGLGAIAPMAMTMVPTIHMMGIGATLL